MIHEHAALFSSLPMREWRAIAAAGMLAHEGRHSEAEAVRYCAGYHNLTWDDRPQGEPVSAAV